MPFEIIDGPSAADIAFTVRADDLPGLFIDGAKALMAVMLEDTASVQPAARVEITCEAPELDLLFHEFLQEILFRKDVDKMLLIPQSVTIARRDDVYRLTCIAGGEQINREKHRFVVDVKAITFHGLAVTHHEGTWTATAVVDV